MNHFSMLRAIPLSFYSRDLYRDVVRGWRGTGALYLLLVSVLCTLPVAVAMQVGISGFAREEADAVVRQIPAITIRLGRVSTSVHMPYMISTADGAPIAIIDTTGQVASLDGTEARVLLTANRLYFRKSSAETRVLELARVDHFDVDQQKATRWLRLVTTWFATALSPFVLVFVFVSRIVQVVVFAAIGMVIARSLQVRLDFEAMMRLTAVAFTPMLLIDTLRGAAGLRVPMWWLLSSLLALAYLVFALRANREPEPEPALPTAAAPPPPPISG